MIQRSSPRNPSYAVMSSLEFDVISPHDVFEIPVNAGWTVSTTGSGVVTQNPQRLRVWSGTNAQSSALARTLPSTGWFIGEFRQRMAWSKPILFDVVFSVLSTSNGVTRVLWGKSSTTIGELANKGIGIRIDGAALKGLVHDGTTLHVVDLQTALVTNIVYRLTLTSDGSGRFVWALNGFQVGESTDGPDSISANGEDLLSIEVENKVDAASQFIDISAIKFYTGV